MTKENTKEVKTPLARSEDHQVTGTKSVKVTCSPDPLNVPAELVFSDMSLDLQRFGVADEIGKQVKGSALYVYAYEVDGKPVEMVAKTEGALVASIVNLALGMDKAPKSGVHFHIVELEDNAWQKAGNMGEFIPSDESVKTANDYAAEINELSKVGNAAKGTIRANLIVVGEKLTAAKNALSRLDDNGVAIQVSNKAWSEFVKTQISDDIWAFLGNPKGRNALSECMRVAQIPSDVMSIIPMDMQAPKSIDNWINKAAKPVKEVIARKVRTACGIESDVDLTVKDLGNAKALAKVREYVERAIAEGAEAGASDVPMSETDVGGVKLMRPDAEQAEIRENRMTDGAILAWKFGEWLKVEKWTTLDGHEWTKSILALGKGEVEEAESESGEGEGVSAESALNAFADMSVFDAKEMLIKMLATHPEAGAIVDAIDVWADSELAQAAE